MGTQFLPQFLYFCRSYPWVGNLFFPRQLLFGGSGGTLSLLFFLQDPSTVSIFPVRSPWPKPARPAFFFSESFLQRFDLLVVACRFSPPSLSTRIFPWILVLISSVSSRHALQVDRACSVLFFSFFSFFFFHTRAPPLRLVPLRRDEPPPPPLPQTSNPS